MKKIKGLLLFGILTLLGIGSSFSQFYDLRDNTGSQLLIPSITHISSAPRSRFTFTLGNSDYYSSGYTSYNHELTNIYACYDSSYNVIGFRDTWGLMTFGDISNCSSSANRSLITPSSGTNGIRIFNYLYMRSNTSISPYSERKDSSILRYLYFDFNKYYTYSGYVQDIPDGYFRRNLFLSVAGNYGVVSQSLTDGSFLFTSLFDDSFSISNPSIYSGFILLHFGGYDSEYYNGRGTLLLSVLNESIIFNYYTGFYLNYSDISQVSPSLNGYITYNNSISEGYSKFFQMITGNNNVILINGSIPSNQLVFTAYGYTYYKQTNLGGGLFTKTTSYDFNFEFDDSVPTFITPSGNGNQSFPDPILDGGVFDANTYLIEESIKCYLTSGEVCNSPFTYENSTNYVNSYDHQERVRNSTDKTGYLTFNNSVDMLSQYCLNVNTIQYAFCSQLYLYEGFPITYYYNNGYFNYIISGSGWQVNLGTLWSGQLGYAYCEGPFCSNFNEGLPQFIRKDTGDYSAYGFSGEYVSLDFFKNYFENGFFFQCPFSYSGSYFTIGSKLIDRLDNHDPLKPINCMIAGFSHGIKSSFFGDSKLGLSHSGVFLQNTGPFATRFYTFIDIVLSLGYIFLFSKLFKFLKKH